MLEYRELKIRITRDAAGGYRTYAEGPSGNASGYFVPPYSSQELDEILREISGQVGRARRRRVEAPDTARVKHFGGVLFDALFEDDLRDVYSASLRAAEDQGKGLRVTLSLNDAPELMLVPWEFLYDEPSFLSISDSTPVVRYLDLRRSREPIQIIRPLRILAMVSSPAGAVELDVEREIENIDRALAPLKAKGAVDITWLDKATLKELQSCLRGGTFHVFHYIGHGEYDDEREDGVLLLEDRRGYADPVSGENLGLTLANHRSLRLAILNSCEGGRTADDDPFAGVATSLVQAQIPAVIAMQFEITDRMASVFSECLYESLADGLPVDQALSQARLAIFNERRGIEWGTPVLFMRVQDGRIFVPEEAPPPDDEEPVVADDVLPWWRKRIAAVIAAVVVALLAVSTVGYAVSRGGKSPPPPHPPPPPPQATWSSTDIPGMNRMLGVTAGRPDEAFAVGATSGKPAVQHYMSGGWSAETVEDASGVMTSVAFSGGVAIAAGRVNEGAHDVDAAVWKRGNTGWVMTCADLICGDSAPGAVQGRQQIFDLTVSGAGTFVAVGREKARGGQWHPAVWRLDPGSNWTRVSDAALDDSRAYMTGVVARGNRIVAVGNRNSDGAAWVSTDGGGHWTKAEDDALTAQGQRVEPQAVSVTSEGFVAVGLQNKPSGPVAWTSDDGLSWRSASIPDSALTGQQMADVTPTRTGLLAVGTDRGTKQAAAWQSADGRNWRLVSSSSFSDEGQPGMSSTDALVDGTVLAVGSANKMGRVWTQTPPKNSAPTSG
jgi:CHAT domain